jgi:ubiquinone/menaquinone biosynthesis C-methylase UbiE
MAIMENGVELMSNSDISILDGSLRQWLFRHRELRVFEKMLQREGISLDGAVIMDAGCGSGVSTGILMEKFRPSRVIAFDYMPEMIARARRKGLPVDFQVGDMRHTGCQAASVDAVFIVMALHHMVDWDRALGEMYRVLRPGGVLLIEEPQEGGFSWSALGRELVRAGFDVRRQGNAVPFMMHNYLCIKPRA